MQRFNDLADFSLDELDALLELAGRLDRNPEPRALEGKVLSLLFLSPSLRTLASFQAAMVRLGGGSFVISPDMSIQRPRVARRHRHGRRRGGAYPRSRAGHRLVRRRGRRAGRSPSETSSRDDLADKRFGELAALTDAPLINMESAINHPCQSLADWKTMDDLSIPKQSGRFVLSWAWHPLALPLAVPAATVHMAALRGMDVTVAAPGGFRAARGRHGQGAFGRRTVGRFGQRNGRPAVRRWRMPTSSMPSLGLRPGTTATASPIRPCAKSSSTGASTSPWFEPAEPDCRFMHCLPVRRGVVVADRILDGPRSVVIEEARNRMVAQMAVLYRMLKG